MARIDALPTRDTLAPKSATDFVGLAQLKAQAGGDGDQKAVTREAARQFEALFVQMMLKSMREASAVFGTGEDTSYREMFDQQIALEMTKGKGLGLADVLTRQLGGTEAALAATPRAPGAADVIAARLKAAPVLPRLPGPLAPEIPDSLLQATAAPSLQFAEPAAHTPAAPPLQAAQNDWKDWRPATPEQFITDIWPHAAHAAERLGVDPRALVAQAALETGWGRNVTRTSDGTSGNNLFNIKADRRWDGPRVTVRTLEFERGVPRQEVAAFRAYPDLKSAFDDYVDFMKGNPRYAEALAHGREPAHFADHLQRAGYATDPGYASKIRSILTSPRLNAVVGQLTGLARMVGR
jgi:flagellar protein FlgJ